MFVYVWNKNFSKFYAFKITEILCQSGHVGLKKLIASARQVEALQMATPKGQT